VKKKIMAILLTAVMVMSMASSAFAATDPELTPGMVADEVSTTVEWYASNIYKNLTATTVDPAYIMQAYYNVFLSNMSGVKSESVTKLTQLFKDSLADNLAKYNGEIKTVDGFSGKIVSADPTVYAGIIAILSITGENPASFNGQNYCTLFADKMASTWTGNPIIISGSPYNLTLCLAVLDKYKSSIPNADEWKTKIIAAAKEYYYPNGYGGAEKTVNDVAESDEYTFSLADAFDNGAEAFSTLIEGTDYTKDQYGYYAKTGKEQTVINALQPHVKVENGQVAMASWGNNCVVIQVFQPGKGIYYYGYAGDNDAKFAEILASDSGSKDIVNALVNNLADYTLEDGSVCYALAYGSNANTTGLALAAYSIVGNTSKAATTYKAIQKFYNKETGAFQVSDMDDYLATKDSLEGVISYYRLLAGDGSIFNLSPSELFKGADEEKYDIVKTGDAGEKIQYKHGSGKGLTVKSNADLSKFVAVRVDDKVVPMKYVQLEEGSTVVTIASEYLDALDAGPHTVTIQSTDGFATASFTVTGAAPNTGDANMILLFAALAIVSGMGLAVYGKKRYMR